MGARGPAPKRSEERKGHSHGSATEKMLTKGELRPVDPMPPNEEWCEIARYVYDSFDRSGISYWAQDTEYAQLWLLADNVDAYVKSGARRSAMMMAEIRQAMSNLSFTEGDRRRVGIELDHPVEEAVDQGLAGVIDARERLRKKA